MAYLGNFDASKFEAPSFGLIPAGKYSAMITASEVKPNKAGTGSYLELTFTITEGEHKGRQLWVRLNIEHPNEKAVQVARHELAAICRAVGVLTLQDSVQLHGVPLVVRVIQQPRRDTGEIVNTIKGYEPRATAEWQVQQPKTDTPPWRRG